MQRRNKTEQDQFHEVVLHGETLVFITTAIVATVAEVESCSTFCETCLATGVQKFHETTQTGEFFFFFFFHASFLPFRLSLSTLISTLCMFSYSEDGTESYRNVTSYFFSLYFLFIRIH